MYLDRYHLHPADHPEGEPLLQNMVLLLFGMMEAKKPHHHKVIAHPIDPLVDTSYLWGRVFAWTCTGLYLSSRLPQIYWNFKRQSVNGLSISMFGFAVLGNLTYALSLLIKSQEASFLYGALPYLLGSAGTVTFDFIIFCQYVVYSRRTAIEEDEEEI